MEMPGETAETAQAPVQGAARSRRRAAQAARETEVPRTPETDGEEQPAQTIAAEKEKETSSKRAAKVLDVERIGRVMSAAGKAGKGAMKKLGGVILLLIMAAGEWGKKLGALGEKLLRAAKDQSGKCASHTPAMQQEEYELEMIRPQDYHGRSQTHTQRDAAGAQKTAADMLQKLGLLGKKAMDSLRAKGSSRAQLMNRLLSVLLVCVALYSAWQIGSIVLRSVRTNRLNDSLAQQRAAIIGQQELLDEEDEGTQEESDFQSMADEALMEETQMEKEAETAALSSTETDEETASDEEGETAKPEPTRAPDVVRSTKYRAVGGEALPEMADLYAKNRDLVAWIQIPDVLDLPVVYRDNSYYLTRDFNKQKNAAGTIFLDENHPFKEKTQNLLLHGHNMKDGTMFGHLTRYLSDDTYIRNHPFIYFDTLWHKEQYVIVAVLDVSLNPGDPRFFNYFTHDTFASDREFETYVRQMQLRSCYAIPIDVKPSDALLTLSTCLDDDRLVIVARRLRENETRSELRALIRMTTRQ